MFQFMQRKQHKLAPKVVHQRDQAVMRADALQVFNVLLETVSARFGLEDLMWILASSLHVRVAGIFLIPILFFKYFLYYHLVLYYIYYGDGIRHEGAGLGSWGCRSSFA
jgi:hypothetical protein